MATPGRWRPHRHEFQPAAGHQDRQQLFIKTGSAARRRTTRARSSQIDAADRATCIIDHAPFARKSDQLERVQLNEVLRRALFYQS
jgi:hypothetical protein